MNQSTRGGKTAEDDNNYDLAMLTLTAMTVLFLNASVAVINEEEYAGDDDGIIIKYRCYRNFNEEEYGDGCDDIIIKCIYCR